MNIGGHRERCGGPWKDEDAPPSVQFERSAEEEIVEAIPPAFPTQHPSFRANPLTLPPAGSGKIS